MIKKQDLYKWCSIPAEELESHPELVIRFRMVKDSCEMGQMMARELVDEIAQAGREERQFRAIVPCGPKCWYAPFAEYINKNRINMKHVTIFHMDPCSPAKARLLLKEKKAIVKRRTPFTIQLTIATGESKQPVSYVCTESEFRIWPR